MTPTLEQRGNATDFFSASRITRGTLEYQMNMFSAALKNMGRAFVGITIRRASPVRGGK